MMAARYEGEGKSLLVIVFEPGNFDKMKIGQPVHKFLSEFIPNPPPHLELVFVYSPDIQWVCEQMETRGSENLFDILKESLLRPPVVNRDKSAEEMRKVI